MGQDFADDLTAIARIDAVTKILDVICRTTGMGFAAVARVTDNRWVACAVRDDIAFGLRPGDEIPIAKTFCQSVRAHDTPIVIDHVARDPRYRDHFIPQLFGFQSYISVPIRRKGGGIFGTLCAVDPRPMSLDKPETIDMFGLFADLIAVHLDLQQQLVARERDLERERELATLREQFIAVLGHDLGNPLQAIMSSAETLALAPSHEPGELISVIRESCGRMERIIADVLDFTRGRLGGGIQITTQPDLDVARMIEAVVAESRVAWPGRQLESNLEVHTPVRCDPMRVAQLLSNLLANALMHGDAQSPVRIYARADAGVLELTVANQGAPIPDDIRPKLFQPFSRSYSGEKGSGLGLGLYICAEIARAHHGRLDFTSDENETRFTFRMPALVDELRPPSYSAASPLSA